MKPDISFSSDTGEIKLNDLNMTSRISEEFFGTHNDASQIPTTQKTRDWIYKNAKDYLNLVRVGDKIIGYAFLLPCNKIFMDEFISKEINEAKLFEKIKNLNTKRIPETIYLCASVIKEEFRGKGLSTTATIKIIRKVTDNLKKKPILFFWGYSKNGKKTAKKVSKLINLKLKERKE